MGEAKRRGGLPTTTVYHHTSTLRTNQLWMTGSLLPEGKMPPVFHPQLGEIRTDARFRRAMVAFPPVVWLTRRISIPNCLRTIDLAFVDETGKRIEAPEANVPTGRDIADQIALNRFAIGFPLAVINATRWADHPGFGSDEGRELNKTAREAGDDPADWYVSEEAIDLMLASEVWFSRSRTNPKLTREDWYLKDMRGMVERCRSTPGTYIPPSWLTPEQAKALAAKLGVKVISGSN